MSSMNGENNRLWIIDCDPGCDDAIALALAAERLATDAVVVLTAAGNVGVDLTTWNACRVMAACGKLWPVYRGCGRSLSGEAVPASSVHGRDGLGDVPNTSLQGRIQPPQTRSAVEFLLECARGDRRLVLVCTGPLTNLATAVNLMTVSEQERLWGLCDYCVAMGGAFGVPGNITAAAEFNCHFDPVAVHIVLDSWRVAHERGGMPRPIHFVPLDVTETVGIPLPLPGPADESVGLTPRAAFLRAALRKYGLFHAWFCRRPREQGGDAQQGNPRFGISEFSEGPFLDDRMAGKSGLRHLSPFCYLHDPLAVWMAVELVSGTVGDDAWVPWNITIDINHGPGRGRVSRHRLPDSRDNPSRHPPLGTPVLWLHPQPFAASAQKFVDAVKVVLELPLGTGAGTGQ